jgi:hypothetical protein
LTARYSHLRQGSLDELPQQIEALLNGESTVSESIGVATPASAW